MFEGIRGKRVATAAVVLFGGGLVVGCGNTVEGVGNIPMVNCSPHGTPRANTASVAALPRGEQIEMGNKINTDTHGNLESGDFVVTSKGNGQFTVNIHSGNDDLNTDVALIPNYTRQPNTATVSDNGETYAIQGSPGPAGATALNISVSCA